MADETIAPVLSQGISTGHIDVLTVLIAKTRARVAAMTKAGAGVPEYRAAVARHRADEKSLDDEEAAIRRGCCRSVRQKRRLRAICAAQARLTPPDSPTVALCAQIERYCGEKALLEEELRAVAAARARAHAQAAT